MLPEPRVQGDVSSAAAGVLLILNTAQLTNTHNTTDHGYIGVFNLEHHESGGNWKYDLHFSFLSSGPLMVTEILILLLIIYEILVWRRKARSAVYRPRPFVETM